MPLASILTQALPNGVIPVGQPGAAGGPGGPAPPGLGSGWEVKVLGAPDYYKQLAQFSTQILTSVQFVKQINDKGSGTVTLSMDDAFWGTTLPGGLAAHNILDYEHLWQVWQDGVLRFEFLGETITEQLVDAGEQRIVTVTGPGSMAVLGWAMAMPAGFPNIVYKLDAISDGFSETDVNGNLVLDTNLWNQAQPLNRVSLNPSGTAQVMASPGTTYLGTSVFDATETLISANIRPMVSPNAAGQSLNGSQLTQFYIQDMNNSGNYALMGVSGTSFYCRFGSGTTSQTKVITSATGFNAATGTSGTYNYDYWMISEHAGFFYFWTSNDGQNWTQQWKVAHSWRSTQVAFFFSAQYSVDNTQYATITSLNSNVANSSLAGTTYLTQPILGVWLQTLRAAQSRGTVPFVTTRMTTTGDSYGNPWTDTQSVQIANGTDLFSLLQAHCSMVNADFIMEPGFLLKVAIPVSGKITLGADRSQQVIFREASAESGKTRTRTRAQIANLLGVVNADGRTVTTSDSTSIANWAQREAWLAAGVQVTEQDIAIVASASVQQTAAEQLAWTMTIIPNVAGKTVFRDFQVGDWVGLERPDYSAVDAVRVIAIAVSVDNTGLETHELTLVSYIAWLQEQFNYIQQKMGGNLLSVTGTTQVAGGITSRVTPTVFAPTLAGLGDVLSAGASGNAPLVYDPVTGKWVPAGTQNPDTGTTASMTVTGSSGTTTVTGGQTTVSAAPAPPADGSAPATPAPTASTTTTPTGHTITDSTGTTRVIVGAQADGTVTVKTVNAPAPAAPDSPTCVAGTLGVIVGWDGLLGGAQPLSDFRLVQVHGSTTSGFTPSTSTLQGTMVAGGLFGIGGLAAGTVYYVKLVALNMANTASAASAQSSATPLTVASGIGAGSLPGTAIQTGTITSSQISPTAGILGSQLSPTAGIVAGQVAFTASAIGGGPAVTVSSTAPSSPNVNDLWFNGNADYMLEQYTSTGWVPYQFGTQAIQAGSVTAAQIAASTITAAQIASGTITATQMAAGSISAAQIQSGTITAGLLAAGIVVAGIINGTVVTGSTIQNSNVNPRTSINPDGSISITNASGVVIFRIGPDGTIYWYNSAGLLLMELQPGGTQVIYASLIGPSGVDFEPPAAPLLLVSATSTTSATIYSNQIASAVPTGTTITVVASANSTATPATAVTDSQGNTYTLLTSQATVAPQQYVFQAVNVSHALATTDSISVTFSVANTTAKNIIAVMSTGVPTVSPLDVSNTSTGTSTAPAVAATPTGYGESLMFILSNAGATGPTAVVDGWSQVGTISGATTTNLYNGSSITPGTSVTASATLGSSVAWNAVFLAYKDASPQTAPTASNATFSASTLWSDSGNFSCKVTKSGASTPWGITYQTFAVTPGTDVAMRVIVGTANGAIAMAAADWGFTFFSGPNGSGTNLGSQSHQGTGGPYYNLTVNTYWILTYDTIVPAGAQSATVWFTENQADTAGNFFLTDNLTVPGGLVYSNSPVATTDSFGNQVSQGINFVGLPGVTNVFGVEDPYSGGQLMAVDGAGNITGQTITAANDLVVAGQSVPNDLISPLPLGIVNYGYKAIGATAWPGTAIGTTEVALFELDQQMIAGRAYEFVMAQTLINATAAGSMHIHLRYTTDGSQPSTSSGEAMMTACRVEATGTDAAIGPLIVPFYPTTNALFKMLVTGHAGSGTYQFKNDDYIRCMVYDLGVQAQVNNLTVFGTGSSGSSGTTPQTYNEYFDCASSWSFWEYGQRNTNSTMYQGAYQGEGYSQHAWMQWGTGSRGNNLNTVLNYTVNYVKVRFTNQHSWYNSGATISWHSASGHTPNQGLNGVSVELDNWHINEGQTLWHTLGSGGWSPFKAGGVTYAVIHPPNSSLDLGYYSYFAGPNAAESNKPQLWVNYTH